MYLYFIILLLQPAATTHQEALHERGSPMYKKCNKKPCIAQVALLAPHTLPGMPQPLGNINNK